MSVNQDFQVYGKGNEFINFIWKNVPGLGAVIITDKNANVLECDTSIQFEKEFSYSYLVQIAKTVSEQFTFTEFHNEMGGLGLTINVFKKYTMLVTSIDSNRILILIVPNETDINSSMGFVSNIEEFYKP